jgi:simple sugar transport system ATP-binding protein
MEGISKEYFGNPVLKGVDVEVRPGEIVCLLGENGAGKSTLMNVLFGMPVIHETGGFRGRVTLAGETVAIDSPFDAMRLGIGMVHQEFMLLPGLTVTENIKLNREITRGNALARAWPRLATLDRPAMAADARVALEKVGLDVDPDTEVGALPVGHKQFLEIAREVDKTRTRVLVFDEPSAVLTESEALRLLEIMKKLAGGGIAILFITHRLDEVMDVADRIVVLRDGERVATLAREEATVARIAELMVGRKIEKVELPPRPVAPGTDEEPVLSIRGLHVAMPGEAVHGVDLDVRRGEILGIGGLAGFGKVGIANGILGLYPAAGAVRLGGEPLPLGDPAVVLSRGVAFVSEDRRGVGLLLDESVQLNMALTALHVKRRFLKWRFPGITTLDGAALDTWARARIADLDIRCTGPDQPVRRLSGGNQQKVCIARALALEPRILFVSEPTRGVDIGAKKLILDALVSLNRKGMTVVMTSSELAELRQVCDRIAIIAHGLVSAILPPGAPDADFGLAMAGARRPAAAAPEAPPRTPGAPGAHG